MSLQFHGQGWEVTEVCWNHNGGGCIGCRHGRGWYVKWGLDPEKEEFGNDDFVVDNTNCVEFQLQCCALYKTAIDEMA